MGVAKSNSISLVAQENFSETKPGLFTIFPVKRKQIIYYEGHPSLGVYRVLKGRVKVHKMGFNGKPHILYFADPGEFLGIECVVSGEDYSSSGEMVVDGEVAFVEKRVFTDLINANTQFALEVAAILAGHIVKSHEERARLAEETVRERMARALACLGNHYGIRGEQGILISIPLSRDDLANMIGSASGTVMRLLKDFKDDRIIILKGKNIIIQRMEYLEKLAHIG